LRLLCNGTNARSMPTCVCLWIKKRIEKGNAVKQEVSFLAGSCRAQCCRGRPEQKVPAVGNPNRWKLYRETVEGTSGKSQQSVRPFLLLSPRIPAGECLVFAL
jgi:hypothetical protein